MSCVDDNKHSTSDHASVLMSPYNKHSKHWRLKFSKISAPDKISAPSFPKAGIIANSTSLFPSCLFLWEADDLTTARKTRFWPQRTEQWRQRARGAPGLQIWYSGVRRRGFMLDSIVAVDRVGSAAENESI